MTLFPNRFQFTSPSKLHVAWVFRARLRFYLFLFCLYLLHIFMLRFETRSASVGWSFPFDATLFCLVQIGSLHGNDTSASSTVEAPAALEKCINIFLSYTCHNQLKFVWFFFSSLFYIFVSFATEHRVEKFSSLLLFDISSTFFFSFFFSRR